MERTAKSTKGLGRERLFALEPVCPLCARWPRAAPGRLLALWPAGLFPYVYVYVCVARVGVFPLGPLRCVA